jgi:hypothetical protein
MTFYDAISQMWDTVRDMKETARVQASLSGADPALVQWIGSIDSALRSADHAHRKEVNDAYYQGLKDGEAGADA